LFCLCNCFTAPFISSFTSWTFSFNSSVYCKVILRSYISHRGHVLPNNTKITTRLEFQVSRGEPNFVS
jgi:hypothetical protein